MNVIEDTTFDDGSYRLLVICTIALVAFDLCIFTLMVVLGRLSSFFHEFSRDVLMVIMKWIRQGDPFGRRLGRTQCHRCAHERGVSTKCQECGAMRIDPV